MASPIAFPVASPAAYPAASPIELGISALSANAPEIPVYEKFELTFDVNNSVASNPQLPYDPAPPSGLPGRIGVSVEGLFLPPDETDWDRAFRQPGFLYQDYERRQIDGAEWLYPKGKPLWKVRFAPKTRGAWRYKVRVQDASICPKGLNPCPNWVESREGSFIALPASPGNHGFVEVSEADPRYFGFSDGKMFLGLGHNTAFNPSRFTYDADEQLARYAANGVDFLRVWMTGSAIAGSSWGPWVWFGGPGYGGYLPDPGLWIAPADSGHDFALYLNQQSNRLCLFNGFSQGPVAVKPGTSYRLSVTARVVDLAGPRNAGNPNYGLTIKIAGWPDSCPDGLSEYPNLIPYLGNTDWTTVHGTFTTAESQWFLNYLFLVLDNATSGQAYVSEVSLREMLPDGTLGPEVLAKSKGDAHMDFNLLRSWGWDYVLDQAGKLGVYLKLVVLEKNDRVWNFISANGSRAQSEDNDNFYAAPNTKVRRLQEYYWRYLAARWGYSTAVHSWELLNEGDPYNGHHHELANSFARYMHQTEPTRHLVTTSLWHSYPVAELWGNPKYPDIDYADIHAYISTGKGDYEWSPPSGTTLETDPANTYRGSAGAIRLAAGESSDRQSVWVRGRGEWRVGVMIRARDIVGSCPYEASPKLVGPQLLVDFDSRITRVIPYDPQKPDQHWICTSPAGTYDYTRVEGLVNVADDDWHLLTVSFLNKYATSGTAWFDDLEVRSPDGRLVRLYGDGSFDDRERMDHDTALYTEAISLLYGARSVSGSGKPIVRGEAGIDRSDGPRGELPELAKDVNGVWLHNYLWGTLNSGGLYELYWWTQNIVKNNLYFHYRHLKEFMADIPLNNGRYEDAQARVSSSDVRVVGQRDRVAGRAHLWIQNKRHTWWNAVNAVDWGRLSGTVIVPGFAPNRAFRVEWWQFDNAGSLTTRQDAATADESGNLVLDLSSLPDIVTDVAVKIN